MEKANQSKNEDPLQVTIPYTDLFNYNEISDWPNGTLEEHFTYKNVEYQRYFMMDLKDIRKR